ncbi:delta and Notch-like epidermal growth factor-related receptor isoform X2 [Pelodiscus sinensis]|uniref:delta and Notch-like epidermal growth factor-related receptor isoform X2 n=1 Tax=Pelodiscus sinensis TaxID=13735 RepID=UPI003F6B2653
MPRAAPLLLLLLSLAQRRAGLGSAAPPEPTGDPCLSQPCGNNGTCSAAPARPPATARRLSPPQPAYRCACPAGVTGTHCQFVSDPCASNPCRHGNCSNNGDGYLCVCNEGYEGTNCERSFHSHPVSEWAESLPPRQIRPVSTTLEPDIVLPRSRATVTLPTWQPKAGQKVVDLKWDEIEITPDVACGNASSNNSAGGRLISFEVPQNTSIKIRQDAIASLILLWKVTTAGFKQCSLIDGRSVTLLQALGGLVLSEEMLALGNNYFIGFVNDSATKCIVALRLTVVVKVSTCLPVGSHSDDFQCLGKGKCITKPSEATFFCDCEDQYMGAFCEEFNACQSRPCQNNGTCTDVTQKHDGKNFTCTCPNGYTGELCQSEIDHCSQEPCRNGGTCFSNISGFSCQCPEGYHGLYCEEEYNECLSAPCQNAATCRDLVNSYECVCLAEYEGRHCELYKDPCVNISCQNGGTCDSEGLNATCICAPGFTGEECEFDINDCDSNPCHHAGTCIDQPNGYTCHCQHGWVGANCEIHLQWKSGHMAESLTNMPRHSLYIIIGALCVAFVLMLIILIVGICRISRIEYQGSSRPAYEEFYNCRSIDSEFSSAIASIRHARFGKKSRPAMYDATPIAYEDYSPDDKPLVTLIKTKDL